MRLTPTAIPAVVLIEPKVHHDGRGYFVETYHAEKFKAGGLDLRFVQDNSSLSSRGVLRGLHAQLTRPQGKLVRVTEGEIWDVAVDVRRGSPSFGKWVAERLSEQNFRQLYIPPGFVHGYCVLSPRAKIEYKCTELYHPEDEVGILWSDPELAIAWPLKDPILSEKDKAFPSLARVRDRLPKYQ